MQKRHFCHFLTLGNWFHVNSEWQKNPTYSVWHLVVQILFKFFQSQNHFSLYWLILQSNKNIFAHYIFPRVQKFFCKFIVLANSEKTGSEWDIIFPKNCTTKCQTLYVCTIYTRGHVQGGAGGGLSPPTFWNFPNGPKMQ